MGRAHLARRRIVSYESRIKTCEGYRKHFVNQLQVLKNKCLNREITYEEYQNLASKKQGEKTFEEWIKYYDNYILECKNIIESERGIIKRSNIISSVASLFFISILILLFATQGGKIIGFATQDNSQTYTENINLNLENSSSYEWQIKNLGQLTSLKISGKLLDSGSAKIYLDNILILDSNSLKSEKNQNNFLTGFAVQTGYNSEVTEDITNPTQTKEKEVDSPKEEVSPSPSDSTSAPNEILKEITFSNYCQDTCDLENLNLNKSIYTIRIELDNSEIDINSLTYGLIPLEVNPTENNQTELIKNQSEILNLTDITNQTQTNETILNETISNITEISNSTLKLIKEIPTQRLSINQTINITLSDYFENSYFYEFIGNNLNSSIAGEILSLSPSENFKGATKGKIIAYRENESLESNEFVILISSNTVSISTTRSKIIVGEPVKWEKNISFDSVENLTLSLPENAKNIKVTETSKEENSQGVSSLITGNVISNFNSNKPNFFKNFFNKLRKAFTGYAVNENAEEISPEVNIILDDNSKDYQIEYYTEAPTSQEIETEVGKEILISGPDSLHYTDVIASTNIPNSIPISSSDDIKLFWHNYENNSIQLKEVNNISEANLIENSEIPVSNIPYIDLENTFTNLTNSIQNQNFILQEMPFDAYDLDGDNNLDYIEWVVPHLSNQTFTLIFTRENSSTVGNNISIEGLDNSQYSHLSIDKTSSAHQISDNIISYYPFDKDDATTSYDFANNYNGTFIANNITNSTNCVSNNCFQLNGAGDYISVTDTPLPIDWTNRNWSASVWARLDADAGLGIGIFSNRPGNAEWVTLGYTSQGFIGVEINGGAQIDTTIPGNGTGWQYYALVKNDSGLGIYINTTYYHLTNTPGSIGAPNTVIAIGDWFNGGQTWKGALDEFMFLNISLNDSQVSQIYQNTSRRYVSSGIQEIKFFNITSNVNQFNLSLQNYNRKYGTNISARIGSWDISKDYNLTDLDSALGGLVAYYNFDNRSSLGENETKIVDRMQLYNATAWNGPTSTPNGNFNRAFNFDGINDEINVSFTATKNTTTLWYKKAGLDWIFFVNTSNQIYVNGINSTALEYPLDINGNNIRIGKNGSGWFNGSIDEVMVFNRTLTENEVKELYIKGRALWTYSNYENITKTDSNDNSSKNSFNISSSTTHILPSFLLTSDSNRFYTPILKATTANPANATTDFIASPDTTSPVVTINFPSNTTYSTIHLPLMFNVSLNENGSARYSLDNGLNNYTLLNSTGGTIGSILNRSNGSISSGSYVFRVYANDTSGNNNNTANVTFSMDVTSPVVTIISPTATTYTTSSLVFNVSLNENGTVRYSLNAGLFNYTMQGNATGTGFNATNTSIADGTYTFHTYTNDTLGNNNNTANVTFTVSVAGGNSVPIITSVNLASTFSITENSFTPAKLNFTVYDADGFTDINFSNAKAQFNRTLETTRKDPSCTNTANFSTNYANFSCTVNIWYFDGSGDWTVNASIGDLSSANAVNQTALFTLGQTSAFVTSPGNLTFGTLSRGASNQTASNDPLLLNNTGNKNITAGNIQINATDLIGETNAAYGIWAANISVGVTTGSSGECDISGGINNATNMHNKSGFTSINQSRLLVGNHSANDGSTGQEQLYFCIRTIGTEIISQAYTTNVTQGPWTIKILSVAFAFGSLSRKKKKISKDKLLKALLITKTEITIKESVPQSEVINILFEEIQKKYSITKQELLQIINENINDTIPVSIFTKGLGGLEAVCKYLKENKGLSYVEIARLLNRDQRTIWTAYNKANKKVNIALEINENVPLLPLSFIGNRNHTVIESSIIYLKEKGFKYVEIAKLLNRDQRNIWTTYKKAIENNREKGYNSPQ